MLRRRLFLQIYLTIVASLVAVVIVAGIAWDTYGRDRMERNAREVAATLATRLLAARDAPQEAQRQSVEALADDLDVDLSLFSWKRELIASTSPRVENHVRMMERGRRGKRWRGHAWALDLQDGRKLIADFGRRGPRSPLLNFLFFLTASAVAVGLVAYPFVRRLTRRLEALQVGVERIGTGDLSARVAVKGRDEVARLAESFNDSAERIETLLSSHRMLLANASHELRTPLSRIRLGVEMQGDGGTPERRAALEQDIAELDELIDEILLMSRLDTGVHADLSQRIDLLALVAEECARYERCEVSGSAPEITGDTRLLPRMVRNLIDNAHKHGRAPVSVELATVAPAPDSIRGLSPPEQAPHHLRGRRKSGSLAEKDGWATITVTDAGPGIAPGDRDKVFEPFYRAANRQNVKGYGLGLALVKQIAEAHGGTVEILSPDTGAAIRVTLPV